MTVIRPVLWWLNLCIACVVLMVVIGGATRLTESGLSIVEWKLVSGILPPLNEASWAREFAEYQTSPQFQKVNSHFGLQEFKTIYWLEYLHRLMGRITGLIFILPLLYFYARRQLPSPLGKRMAIACTLIALQGTVGWIMVASGLHDEPRVAPVKLALHLSLACTVFGYLLWTRWLARSASSAPPIPAMARSGWGLLGIAALQIVMGALVAGLRAGMSYTTWPLMDGHFIPEGLYLLSPWWMNHLENILTVQFQHRMGAYILTLACIVYALAFWQHRHHRRWLIALVVVIFLQMSLGIITLLTVVSLHPALAHQLMALGLITILLRLIYINIPTAHPAIRS